MNPLFPQGCAPGEFHALELDGDLHPFRRGETLIIGPSRIAHPGDLVIVELTEGGLAVEELDPERGGVVGPIIGTFRPVAEYLRTEGGR